MNGRAVPASGASLVRARAAVVMLHGRGASAESMLSLAEVFDRPDVAYLAPQAPGSSWYPHSFLAPIEQNEPALSKALETVADTLTYLATQGFAPDRSMLLGFSQGGCLALEYAARNAQRYGGLVGLSAGLIGPPGAPRHYAGSLAATPIFIGCSDVDFHIPVGRVRESAEVLGRLGGDVTQRIYPGMAHTVNEDEVQHVQLMLKGLVRASLARPG